MLLEVKRVEGKRKGTRNMVFFMSEATVEDIVLAFEIPYTPRKDSSDTEPQSASDNPKSDYEGILTYDESVMIPEYSKIYNIYRGNEIAYSFSLGVFTFGDNKAEQGKHLIVLEDVSTGLDTKECITVRKKEFTNAQKRLAKISKTWSKSDLEKVHLVISRNGIIKTHEVRCLSKGAKIAIFSGAVVGVTFLLSSLKANGDEEESYTDKWIGLGEDEDMFNGLGQDEDIVNEGNELFENKDDDAMLEVSAPVSKRYSVQFKAFNTGEWYEKTGTDFLNAAVSVLRTCHWGRAYRLIDNETGEIIEEMSEEELGTVDRYQK